MSLCFLSSLVARQNKNIQERTARDMIGQDRRRENKTSRENTRQGERKCNEIIESFVSLINCWYWSVIMIFIHIVIVVEDSNTRYEIGERYISFVDIVLIQSNKVSCIQGTLLEELEEHSFFALKSHLALHVDAWVCLCKIGMPP